jgi:hypothetical protein
VGEQDLVDVDVQERRLDPVLGIEVDERRVANAQEVLAMLVEQLREPHVLVLDVPFDQESVGEEHVRDDRQHRDPR